MEKKSKDKLFDKIGESVSSAEYKDCKIDDRECLINQVFSKIKMSDISDLKKMLFDDEILKIMRDEDLLNCVNEFFNNNLNISETSRNAFMHRNTLIYRIDKIYKTTGFNIKNFNDAVSFKILVMLYKNLGI